MNQNLIKMSVTLVVSVGTASIQLFNAKLMAAQIGKPGEVPRYAGPIFALYENLRTAMPDAFPPNAHLIGALAAVKAGPFEGNIDWVTATDGGSIVEMRAALTKQPLPTVSPKMKTVKAMLDVDPKPTDDYTIRVTHHPLMATLRDCKDGYEMVALVLKAAAAVAQE